MIIRSTAYKLLQMFFFICFITQAAEGSDAKKQVRTSKPINGLTWTMKMARDFTTADALDINARLENSSDRQFTFETEGKSSKPLLWLKARGENERITPLVPKEDYWYSKGKYKPKPGEAAEDISIDIREFYGRLPAGIYQFQIIYPKTAYQLIDYPKYSPADIKSAPVLFIIRDTSLAEAQASIPVNQDIRLVMDKVSTAEKRWMKSGRLENHGKHSISLSAYTGERKGGVLSITYQVEKWTPNVNWTAASSGLWCGTGLGSYELTPGEKVPVHLNLQAYRDGIYRFAVTYSVKKGASTYSRKTYSKALAVDALANGYKE